MKKDIAVLSVKDCPIQPLKNSKDALGGLQVFVWGFPSKNIYHYPEGKPVEDCYLSRMMFLFLWEEKAVKGVNIWSKKPEVRVYTFQIKDKFEVGFSGSPVCYSITNQVVGMLTAKDDDYGYVIPIPTILEKIENTHRITDTYRITEPSPSLDMAPYIDKGNKNFIKEDYDEAIKQYDIVLKDRNYLRALTNKGVPLIGLEKYEDAIECFDKALVTDPNNVDALDSKGIVLERLGKYDKAREYYDKASDADPKDVIAR
jgi:tetratricopeptide (TPR) repeat protein